jgi:predicted DNA-binding WGR domain protein
MDTDIEIMFFGWLKDEKSDKVWIAAKVEGKLYAVWGRRGKTLQFKEHFKPDYYWRTSDLEKLIDEKVRKGYKNYTDHPDKAVKDLEYEIKYNLFNAKMLEKIR